MMEEKIKWFSYLNDNPKMIDQYFEHYKVAIATQKLNSKDLKPYLIYDGADSKILDFCDKSEIEVIQKTPRIAENVKSYYSIHQPDQVFDALACFLKPEVPLIVKEILRSDDEYVLLTDTDVLFLNDLSDIKTKKVEFVGMSSEFDINLSDTNAGVMWYNVQNMYRDFSEFENFIVNNFSKFKVFDQDAFKIFYNNRIEKLPIEYNYKPYWNFTKPIDQIKIIHFHGLKPWQYMDVLLQKNDNKILKNLLSPFFIEMYGYYNSIKSLIDKNIL